LVVIPAEAGIQKTALDVVRSVEREPRISLVNIAEGVSFTKRIWDYPFRRVGSTLDKDRFSLIFVKMSDEIPPKRLSKNLFPLPWRLVRLWRRGDKGEGKIIRRLEKCLEDSLSVLIRPTAISWDARSPTRDWLSTLEMKCFASSKK